MEKYQTAVPAALAAGRYQWDPVYKWIENFICGTRSKQMVVGNRDRHNGLKVTQADFDASDPIAQVCPFVRESIDKNHFWIDESDLSDIDAIEALLLSQVAPFRACPPKHDPTGGDGAPTFPTALKTFLTFFPQYRVNPQGPDKPIDTMYARASVQFKESGLMLGQFYRTCDKQAVYNPLWKHVLTAPWLAFAIRYMQPHDRLFIEADPASSGYQMYKKLFLTPPRP